MKDKSDFRHNARDHFRTLVYSNNTFRAQVRKRQITSASGRHRFASSLTSEMVQKGLHLASGKRSSVVKGFMKQRFASRTEQSFKDPFWSREETITHQKHEAAAEKHMTKPVHKGRIGLTGRRGFGNQSIPYLEFSDFERNAGMTLEAYGDLIDRYQGNPSNVPKKDRKKVMKAAECFDSGAFTPDVPIKYLVYIKSIPPGLYTYSRWYTHHLLGYWVKDDNAPHPSRCYCDDCDNYRNEGVIPPLRDRS